MAFTPSTLHVSVPLTDYALAFRPNMEGYFWNRLLPIKQVRKRSDLIRQIDKGNLLRKYDLRAGRGRVQQIQFKVGSNLSFNAIDYAVEALLDNTESMEADEILQYEQEQMYHCLVAMHTNMEVVTIKETLRNSSIVTNGIQLTNVADQWDQHTSSDSDPIDDSMIGINTIRRLTGRKPNLYLMHFMVWDRVKRHPKLLARGGVHPTGNAIITIEQYEDILELPRGSVIIHEGQYNVAAEDQTADFRSFTGPDVVIAYNEPAGPRTYGLGQTFMFQDTVSGGAGEAVPEIEAPFLVYMFPDNGQKSTRGATINRLVGGMDQKVLNSEAAYLIRDVVDKTNSALYGDFLNN